MSEKAGGAKRVSFQEGGEGTKTGKTSSGHRRARLRTGWPQGKGLTHGDPGQGTRGKGQSPVGSGSLDTRSVCRAWAQLGARGGQDPGRDLRTQEWTVWDQGECSGVMGAGPQQEGVPDPPAGVYGED